MNTVTSKRHKASVRKWQKAHPDRVRAYNKRSDAKRLPVRRAALAAMRSAPCTDCGQIDFPELMDFDHVPERGKRKFGINVATIGKADFAKELAKCDLVCVRCHRIRTVRRRQSR